MRKTAFVLIALSLAGCCRRCSSPVDPNKTVYLRGSADPEIRTVTMDDQWGTEDRTVEVRDGSYSFAWLGKDLTAMLGGERSFVVRASGGSASIVSSEFCLRGDVTLNLFLWKPQISVLVTANGILEFSFPTPPDETRYQRISHYDAVLDFKKSETKLDGSRAITNERATYKATPGGTRIPANALKGRSSEEIFVTVEAQGEGSPALRYTAPRVSARAPVAPETSLTLRGTVGSNVTAVEVRSVASQGRRTATPVGGRFEWTWTGPDVSDTLGEERVIVSATGRTAAKIETDSARLRDLKDLSIPAIWEPTVQATPLEDGRIELRFPAADAAGAKYEVRILWFRGGERVERTLSATPGTTVLSEKMDGRTHEEVELQVIARAGSLNYLAAPIRVSLPIKK